MNDPIAAFGRAAADVAELISEDPNELTASRELAGQLRALLPFPDDATQRLALVIETPTDLASEWALRTADLWESAAASGTISDEIADLVAVRLATLGWALGTVPGTWPDAVKEVIIEDWANQEADALGRQI